MYGYPRTVSDIRLTRVYRSKKVFYKFARACNSYTHPLVLFTPTLIRKAFSSTALSVLH